jgi:gluconolactonase
VDANVPVGEGGTTPTDGGADAPPIVYPDPLEGTTKEATLVKGNFRFTEGPVWIGGRLLFTDIQQNQILELNGTNTSVFRANTNGANGLAVDPTGRLLACEGNAHRITRSNAAAGAQPNPIADTYMGKKLNSPNDIIVRADNNIYFTDPNYGARDPASNQLPFEGPYRIDKFGAVTRIDGTFTRANGIALSPDGSTLYVVDNGAGTLLSAPVDAAGVVGAFAKLGAGDVPGGDGMAVDDAGNLYVTDDNGVDVFDRTGKLLGTITVEVKPTNCTFGGTDRKTLYVTANGPAIDGGPNPKSGLYEIKLNVPGLP